MITKLRIKITPTKECEALVTAYEKLSSVSRWNKRIANPLLDPAFSTFGPIWNAERERRHLLFNELVDYATILVEEQKGSTLGLSSYEVRVDLAELANNEQSEALDHVLGLLLLGTEGIELYEMEAIAGNKGCTLAQAARAVRDMAREHGMPLSTREKWRELLGLGEAAAAGDAEEPESASSVDADFETAAKPNGDKKKARPRNEWGNLDDSQHAANAHSGFTEAEQFLLQYASLHWPCSCSDLKAIWKRVAKELHPDTGGDTGRFQLAKDGYEKLMERVGAQVV